MDVWDARHRRTGFGFQGHDVFDIEAIRALRTPEDTAESYADKVRANGVQCHIDHQPNGTDSGDGKPVVQTDVWVRHNGLWESIAVFLPDGSDA